MEIKIMSL